MLMEEIMDNPLYLYDLEYKNVIGVDEAGRGPLAGPVVAAAVILKEYTEELDEINDSKKLTEKKREKLYDIIMKNFDVAVGISTVEEIDKLNILNADFLAMRRALKDLKSLKNEKEYTVLVDGNLKIKKYIGKQLPIVKGDAKSLSIAAASIIAKVTRDRLMQDLANIYPDYSFEKHKGYGTKTHIEAIKDKGAIEGVHRKVFLRKILETEEEKTK
ncbi:ribonuclease HII [Fusobacterium nucleatum subsp. nucleatum]|uniref:Ribonuclease HII n=2 Tax=Fusobacterium nucleatum TaxID=851 RepID=A0A0X3Y2J0_FUSNC|nr:ribonuclease HII [Fusobacterium nucleatum subsp. nucleatum ChDC F316]ASG25963.1 ribonuclease HII [Fusobacterium nucleatum subsp. nucleatum]KUL99239.1 ribonuclease HII [Fusobacterium nucleatum subsp. nucleatum]